MNTLYRFITLIVVLSPFIYCASTRSAQTQELKFSERISSSIDVLKAADSIPEQTIPEAVLNNAYGIAVIPNVVKGAFILGGRFGKGVLAIKRSDGNWSYPSFIEIGGGSVGWQWGVQSIDLVLVFKSEKSVDSIINGKFTLGASAAVAAGPVGRHAEAATNTQLNAEVYSYAKSRGLFVGASLEGTSLSIDKTANSTFYGSDTITANDILTNKISTVPPLASEFNELIETITIKK